MNTRRLPIAFAATAVMLVSSWVPSFAATCMNPAQVPNLQVSKDALCWTPVMGTARYDAVAGLSLAQLRGGAQGLSQVGYSCLGTSMSARCVSVPYDPPAGDGFFFLVRANRGNATASFSTDCPAESPGRDAALVAALCP